MLKTLLFVRGHGEADVEDIDVFLSLQKADVEDIVDCLRVQRCRC